MPKKTETWLKSLSVSPLSPSTKFALAMEQGNSYFPRQIVIPSKLVLGESTGKKQ